MSTRPSKLSIIVIIAFCASTLFLFVWQFHWSEATVSLAGKNLRVLLAKNPHQWQKGVGGRESLAPYEGMLFVFGEYRRHGIVMRDTLFALDIVWLRAGVVTDMAKNVPTEIGVKEGDLHPYYPREKVNVVLELPAGFLDKNGVKLGDKLTLVSE